MTGNPNAAESLLTGLIDYAGLYPPASLDMRTAVSNYFKYCQGAHAALLGRFVVGLDRIDDLRQAAGDAFAEMPLSVIVPAETDSKKLIDLLGDAGRRAALEFKIGQPAEIERISAQLPAHCQRYFELPLAIESEELLHALLDAIAASGARAKLRMGGVVAEAFPAAKAIAVTLYALAQRHIPFKATAGLHHPVRSHHPFTYQAESQSGIMHGFLNLAFAAVMLHFGGEAAAALKVLEEQDADAWRVEPDLIHCRGFAWTADDLLETRREFFISFGSCSFEEPIRDLEVMGWL